MSPRNTTTGLRQAQELAAAALHTALAGRGWEPVTHASLARAAYTLGVRAEPHPTGLTRQYRVGYGSAHTWAPSVRLYLPTWMVAMSEGRQSLEHPMNLTDPDETRLCDDLRAMWEDVDHQAAIATLWRSSRNAKAVAAWLRARPRA